MEKQEAEDVRYKEVLGKKRLSDLFKKMFGMRVFVLTFTLIT
jgi:hypothetical protein